MTVHFIGAGPGAADLITLRGRDLLARCPVCLYAGSTVAPELLAHCAPGARLVDTAPLTLDRIEAEFLAAHAAGQDVARLQSGDLSIYSALAEQLRRLERQRIPYTLTPGVPAFAAAAAVLARELTVPELAQSVVLTRVAGRASRMPERETLAAYAATGATLAIHLAIPALEAIVTELLPHYGADCPIAVVARATWPEQRIVRATLGDIAAKLSTQAIDRSALVLVGRALDAQGFRESALYDPEYQRRLGEAEGDEASAALVMTARGIIVSAARSGAGKTTVTLGLLAALKRRCIAVRAAKSGPDYIDPAFHAAATGAAGVNLDTWAMAPALIGTLVANAAHDADMLVIEGAMGLFDGVPGETGRSGAAADLARRFGVPVLLVLDVTGQSQSAAAVVAGFAKFDPAVRLAGVMLNRVGSERHRMLISDAIAPLGVPVLGAIPRDAALTLPERHLGLVQAGEHADLSARLVRLAEAVETHCDVDAIVATARPLEDCDARARATRPHLTTLPAARKWTAGSSPAMAAREVREVAVLRPPGQRIALASDAAFTFMYPHLLDGWRRAGADIVPFSPLADEGPPDDCDACWLPGGYPELHAGALAAAQNFRTCLVRFAATRPVHGECGGYMVLGEGLIDTDGTHHAMAGLLGHTTSFAKRKLHLGYRAARLFADCPIGAAGAVVRGHEFHHASVVAPGRDQPLAEITDAQGRAVDVAGSGRGHVSGTFFHVIAGE